MKREKFEFISLKIYVGINLFSFFHPSEHITALSFIPTTTLPSPSYPGSLSTPALPSSSLLLFPQAQCPSARPLLPPDQSNFFPSPSIPPTNHPSTILTPHSTTFLNHSTTIFLKPFLLNHLYLQPPLPQYSLCLYPSSLPPFLPPSGSSLASTQKPRVHPEELCIRWTWNPTATKRLILTCEDLIKALWACGRRRVLQPLRPPKQGATIHRSKQVKLCNFQNSD